MSDDGAGIHLVRHLEERRARNGRQNDQIELIDGGTLGYLLIDRVADADLLIVLDAANLGAVPGTYRVVQGEDVYDFLSDRQNRSVHEVGLIDLIQMLDLSNKGPRDLVLIGIQPETIGWGEKLSPSITKMVPAIGGEVERLLNAWIERPSHCVFVAPNLEACT
jgi:hydrogenase maturation protease